MKHPDILKQLTLEQKVALLSGKDVWSTYAFPQAGVPSMAMPAAPPGQRGELGPGAAGGGGPRPRHRGRRPGGAHAPGAWDEPEAQPPGGPEL